MVIFPGCKTVEINILYLLILNSKVNVVEISVFFLKPISPLSTDNIQIQNLIISTQFQNLITSF